MSIFSSASSKAILTAFRYPITLTVVQFAFVCNLCIISSSLAHMFPRLATAIPALKYPIRHPTKQLILTTLPLTAFQIGGHILNSDAMARIPVSLVHTIKGLSPLLTVMAYRIFFRVHYSLATYLSLIPLTVGVVMACSTDFRANTPGLLYAFGSALLFVTQNIVSKRLFNEAARAEVEGPGLVLKQKEAKPDKLNLLCYSSGLAFLLTMPLWLWSEGYTLIGEFVSTGTLELRAQNRPDALHDHRRVVMVWLPSYC
jgi:solute carrier family 35 protein E1